MSSQTHPVETSSRPAHRGSKAAVDVVLLTADEQIFETARNVIAEEHPVWRARATDEAIEHLVSGRCGVLVIDLGTVSSDPTSLVHRVTQQFPDLVVVATGRQADEPLLGSLISDGLVYRFMHKPLSPNRAGMFLSHAIASHVERRQHPGIVQVLLPRVTQMPPRMERRYRYGALAAGLALIAALVAYLIQRSQTPDAADDGASSELVRPQGVGVPPEVLLPRAAAALEAGRLEAPAGDNALDLYRDVLLAEPRHPEASAGLDRASALVLARAHAESVAGRGEEARRLVRRVLSVDPANPLALAMQARLEGPVANGQLPVERPVESLATRLRREFESAPRTAPAPSGAAQEPPAVSLEPLPPPAAATLVSGSTAPPSSPGPAVPADSATGVAAGAAAGATATTPSAAPPVADPGTSVPSLVPFRELTRVSGSQPEYPLDARETGTEGWVRLQFTVNERGRVRDIAVVEAEPRGVFEQAASAALSRWRFRPPVTEAGQPVAMRTSVQLRFELED